MTDFSNVFTETPNGNGDSPFEETNPFRGDEQTPKGGSDDYENAGFGDGTVEDEREKPPVPKHGERRTPLADLLQFGWGGLGTALIQTGADVPVGRVLQFQAPLAAKKLDEFLAGTWIDSLLQPLAKRADAVEGIGVLFAFPIAIAIYERNTELAPVMEPILRQVITATLIDMAPVLKKNAADTRKAAAAIADVTEAFEIPKGGDPIAYVLQSIFAPPPEYEDVPQPEQEPVP